VIVVIGSPTGRSVDGGVAAAGTASRVALAAAKAGQAVQLVGKTGDDPAADAIILDLARGAVGHVALMRDPARPTPVEPGLSEDLDAPDAADGNVTTTSPPAAAGPALEAADVDLGLRYLTDYRVIVVAEPSPPDVVAIASDAARWAEARLILVVGAGDPAPDGLPADVIVFEAPEADPDGVFADLVGGFAAALDRGTDPEVAFRASIDSDGWSGAEAG
jgi:sugar/nucleoside kinase (ribokinase family)